MYLESVRRCSWGTPITDRTASRDIYESTSENYNFACRLHKKQLHNVLVTKLIDFN